MDSSAGIGPVALVRRRRKALLRISAAVLFCAASVILSSALHGAPSRPATSRPSLLAARNFALPALGHPGRHVSLTAYAGRPVIINFFASWCPPCQRETPLLAAFYRAHHEQVLVIGVDTYDEAPAAVRFLASRGVTYPVAYDAFPAPVAATYRVFNLPQTFELNSKHQIVGHVSGDLTQSQLTAWAASQAGHGAG